LSIDHLEKYWKRAIFIHSQAIFLNINPRIPISKVGFRHEVYAVAKPVAPCNLHRPHCWRGQWWHVLYLFLSLGFHIHIPCKKPEALYLFLANTLWIKICNVKWINRNKPKACLYSEERFCSVGHMLLMPKLKTRK